MLSEPSDERVSSIRRSDINKLALLGLLGLGAPSSSSAYCPPNCRPGEEPTATQSPEPAPQQAAPAEPVETKIDLSAPESQSLARITDRAFLDVTFGGRNRSRIVIGLYGDVVPRTVENFKLLVTGAKGYGYNGTEFYRIVPGLQARAAPPRRVRGRLRWTWGSTSRGAPCRTSSSRCAPDCGGDADNGDNTAAIITAMIIMITTKKSIREKNHAR